LRVLYSEKECLTQSRRAAEKAAASPLRPCGSA
jgi:hypothetical protein